jgi:hypothetical protein
MPEPSPARVSGVKGTINIRVNENVTLENLQGILARVVGLTGCRTCGLLGVDLVLGGDPVELQEITKIPGVASASFNV